MSAGGDYRHRVSGPYYLNFLHLLHQRLRPRNYVEIGVRKGETLAYASCPSIGIDPEFDIDKDVVGKKPLCLMFQQTSDNFFERNNPTALLGEPVDLAFLDGMHLLEFLLRDFINVERHCSPDSIILLHDCLPPHQSMTTRDSARIWDNPEPYKAWWTGDVWKIIPVLRKYRPDLSIELVDCAPTGLAMITNLDPQNTVLAGAYEDILAAHAAEMDDAGQFDRFWESLDITPMDALFAPERMTARYRP